ncbi:MAG: synthase subunit alpha [Haloplasmataceae bacterium]|jgi:proton translocating ATP synthase F1 alpha subunit|nr:synthase subunit alpha [Haloplasmataceae bacterium]
MYNNLVTGDTIGKVRKIFDYFVIAEGLDTAFIGEVVYFKYKNSSLKGQILNLERKEVKIALLKGDQAELEINDLIFRTYKTVEIPVGLSILGRIINPLGECLNEVEFDRYEYLYKEAMMSELFEIERGAAGIIEREPVRKPLMTGINVIDFFIPIGMGQRELVIGDNNTGKTSLCVTIVIHQSYWNNVLNSLWRQLENEIKTMAHYTLLPCIYVWVGSRRSEAARLKNLFKISNALNYTTIVFTAADQPASLQYLAPYSGVSIGEWFRDKGHDSLVVYDDLSQQAVAYRQMSLILRRPPGREAYPGDIFYVHSRLLERAGQMNKNKGGGSVTALPIVETKAGDISSYIPTNVISITDGQVFLSLELINKGIRPSVSIGLSVSRVGSAAQYPIMSNISKKLKADYALYNTYAGVQKMGGSVDEAIKAYIVRGDKIIDLFKQPNYQSYKLYNQVIMFSSLINGFVDFIDTKYIKLYFTLKLNKLVASKYIKADEAHYLIYQNEIEALFRSENLDFFQEDFKRWDTSFKNFFYKNIYPRLIVDKNDKYLKMMKIQYS